MEAEVRRDRRARTHTPGRRYHQKLVAKTQLHRCRHSDTMRISRSEPDTGWQAPFDDQRSSGQFAGPRPCQHHLQTSNPKTAHFQSMWRHIGWWQRRAMRGSDL